MVIHMKTTLNINTALMKRIKQEAIVEGVTMSHLIEDALQGLFQKKNKGANKLPVLPVFDSGGAKVDVANREALYDEMERA